MCNNIYTRDRCLYIFSGHVRLPPDFIIALTARVTYLHPRIAHTLRNIDTLHIYKVTGETLSQSR